MAQPMTLSRARHSPFIPLDWSPPLRQQVLRSKDCNNQFTPIPETTPRQRGLCLGGIASEYACITCIFTQVCMCILTQAYCSCQYACAACVTFKPALFHGFMDPLLFSGAASSGRLYCRAVWDSFTCWPPAPAGKVLRKPCADIIASLDITLDMQQDSLSSGKSPGVNCSRIYRNCVFGIKNNIKGHCRIV